MKKLIVLLCFLVSAVSYAQKENLRFNLVKGAIYDYHSSSSIDITQDHADQKMNMQVSVSAFVQFEVLDKIDSVYNLSVVYKSLGMDIKGMGPLEIHFNSESGSNDPMTQMLSKIRDQKFQAKMTELGRILEVTGIEDFVDAMLAEWPAIPDDTKTQLREQLIQSFGEKTFKGNFETATRIYTGNPVAKGDRWTITTALGSMNSASQVVEYIYKDKTDSCRLLVGSGTISILDEASNIISNQHTSYNISGDVTSAIKVDLKTGWIIEADIKQQFKGTIETKTNAQDAAATKIPIVFTATTICRGK